MLVMGAFPTLVGACISAAIFAFAEMTFSHRFYAHMASFAPKGKAGMYMGLAFVPFAIGAWIGGQASGFLVAKYIPKEGPRDPIMAWSTYAALGLVCAAMMFIYGMVTSKKSKDPAPEA
jgi:proton-dependent oligopeptide transporter, POT family